MGGGKGKTPAAPDYTPIAAGQLESAQIAAQVSREQLQWAKETYAQDRQVTDQVIERAFATQDAESRAAALDRERYVSRFQPQEDSLLAEANSYNSAERQEGEAGRAAATVSEQMEAARRGAVADLESYGIDPSQTRSAAMDLGVRVAQAAATAQAANQAREQTINTGRAMRSEAINIGRGYGSQIAQGYNTALAAGNQAVNAGLATTASGANTMGTGTQWGGQALAGFSGSAGSLNAGFNNAMQGSQAKQQQSAGIGSAIGTLAGGALGMFGGPMGAMVGASLGGSLGGMARMNEGGVVEPNPRAQAMLLGDGKAKPGAGPVQAVDPNMSPTGGAATDDVPILANVGELVVPDDVVRWKGEEFFNRLAIKVRQDMGQENPRGLGGRPAKQAVQTGAR